jgi:peptide/nickel transport system ATP-binding protein
MAEPTSLALDPGILIRVEDLQIQFGTEDGIIRAVDGANFDVPRGKTICIVGESGCGKSVTGRSLMNLLPRSARVAGGAVRYTRQSGEIVNVTALDPRGSDIRKIRGREIALISQEPMAALSPVHTIGQQMIEMIRLHSGLTGRAVEERAIEMLGRVGIPRPEQRLASYPFEFSGGMRQRVCIAMALSCRPRLLIADEPTTALDVTTQANIIDLLQELQREDGLTIVFITHDLGVVAEIADEVVVMYLGNVVERGSVDEIFYEPQHPYTQALLRSVPRLGSRHIDRLAAIGGMVPSPFDRPAGCGFHPRCERALQGLCDMQEPASVPLGLRRTVRCLRYNERADG